MIVNAMVDDVQTKTVPNRYKPGEVKNTYLVLAGGYKIDYGFKAPPVRKGDKITAEITDEPNKWGKHDILNGGGTSVETNTTMAAQASRAATNTRDRNYGFPIPKSDHATSICRQNALTAAVNYIKNRLDCATASPSDVLNIAAEFARWTTGQSEMEEAERILAENNHAPSA
jgi:hypothetical protein